MINTHALRLGVLGTAAILILSACSSSGSSPAASAAAPATAAPATAAPASAAAPASVAAAVAPKDAKSAAEAGGIDAVCAAGKAEGTVTLTATPPDWANYGQMFKDFTAKYGIAVDYKGQLDGDSAAEIKAANDLKGTGRQPDLFDLTTAVTLANVDKFAPYQVASWAEIPDANKEATGLWWNNYTGFQSIAYDASLGDITKIADLADPKYKGKVALNGDPLKSGAGFNGVVLAALANGGSADNIAPGVDFFKKLTESGNLIPVDPAPATIALGTTPIVVDWTYNEVPQIAALAPKGTTWKVVIPSDAPPVGAYYNSAINKDAAHPAAARCWMEYIFSDAGGNTWIKGGAMPIRLAAMQKAGTVDQAALAAVNAPTTPPTLLTNAQVEAATQYLKDNWKFINIVPPK